MKALVYHTTCPVFRAEETTNEVALHHIATVDFGESVGIDKKDFILEEAFRLTNSIHHGWWENPNVTFHGLNGARSTSVGDVIRIEDTFYIVHGMGFKLWLFAPTTEYDHE